MMRGHNICFHGIFTEIIPSYQQIYCLKSLHYKINDRENYYYYYGNNLPSLSRRGGVLGESGGVDGKEGV